MNPFVSIVIPVYNANPYLRNCLESIVCQSFENWECILIDDGSTDGSDEICDEYASLDFRFKVFHKQNGGVCSARNYGIDHVSGEWIMFVDADDRLFPNSIETLISHIEDNTGSVVGGYINVSTINDNSNYAVKQSEKTIESMNWQKALKFFYIPYHGLFYGYLWNRIMKTQVIVDNKLRFNEKIFIKEDALFGIEYICACKEDVLFLTKPIYKYTSNENGAMQSVWKSFDKRYLTDLDACIQCYNTIKESGCHDISTLYYAKKYVCTMYDNLEFYIRFMNEKKEITEGLRRKTTECVTYPFFFFMRTKTHIKNIINRIKNSL